MTAQLVLQFDDLSELLKILTLLKEHGIDTSFIQLQKRDIKDDSSQKPLPFGIGSMNGSLDQLNVRDFAYED